MDLIGIQLPGPAELLRGSLPPSHTHVFVAQDAMGCEVERIGMRPQFAILNGLVYLVSDELVVTGGDVEFLALAGAVAEGKSLAKCFRHAVMLPEVLIGTAQIGVSQGEVRV